ncbi:CopM family metallochaperone [Ancylobacter sp. VNQ12]|uniref:CopM family metallochaperone n=1 Tax=Ancylobacter sp. VNQ12 TaxID=3400920 RepID=UPI003C067D1E
MPPKMKAILAFAFLLSPTLAVAQQDAHHDSGAAGKPAPPAAAAPPPPPPQRQCDPTMDKMGEHMSACLAALPQASQAYMRAMMGKHTPMLEAMQVKDPDVAFVKGMISHHQAAIDMARAVFQFGSDQLAKALAREIIASQQAEIDRMRAWLKQRGE